MRWIVLWTACSLFSTPQPLTPDELHAALIAQDDDMVEARSTFSVVRTADGTLEGLKLEKPSFDLGHIGVQLDDVLIGVKGRLWVVTGFTPDDITAVLAPSAETPLHVRRAGKLLYVPDTRDAARPSVTDNMPGEVTPQNNPN
ncbi:MAG: hypothetical protein ACON5B_17830 [Myxococcota bacterium]